MSCFFPPPQGAPVSQVTPVSCTVRQQGTSEGEKSLCLSLSLAKSTANFPRRQVTRQPSSLTFLFHNTCIDFAANVPRHRASRVVSTRLLVWSGREVMQTVASVPRYSTMPGESCLLSFHSSQVQLLNWPKTPLQVSSLKSSIFAHSVLGPSFMFHSYDQITMKRWHTRPFS